MKRHSPPDIQELTSSLDYDPLTGKFTEEAARIKLRDWQGSWIHHRLWI